MNDEGRVKLSLDIKTLQNFIKRMQHEYHLPEYEAFLDDIEEQLSVNQINPHQDRSASKQ